MMALIVAAAILVFSADLRLAVQQFDLDQRPPPPPENIAVLMPAHGEALRQAGPLHSLA